MGTLSFSIARENKHPDTVIGGHLTGLSSDLRVNSTLSFQLTDGSCLWTILRQPGQAWEPLLDRLPECAVGARNLTYNQWLYGLF